MAENSRKSPQNPPALAVGRFREAWEAATANFKKAANKFANPGEKVKLGRASILVQEYPEVRIDGKVLQTDRVAYVFEQRVNGQEMLHVHTFELDPRLVEALILSGDWKRQLSN
jgi:hypothetical protein